jgi:hypothetical protein
VADFVSVVLADGTQVTFQSAESDFVELHGGSPVVERYEGAVAGLSALASAAQGVAESFREKVQPDELELEIAIGLSGEVGWFFAKSALDASIKLTLKWHPTGAEVPPGPDQ